MKKSITVIASFTAAVAGSAGLLAAVASPADANPLISVGQTGNVTTIAATVGDVPGAYTQVTLQPNPEGAPLIQSSGGTLTLTVLSQPGVYVNLTY